MTNDKQWEYLERADDDRTDNSFHHEYPYELIIAYGEIGYPADRVSMVKFSNPPDYIFKSKWKTPSKACEQGVLSWEWVTANSCLWEKQVMNQPNMTPAKYREIIGIKNVWDNGQICPVKPETFYNCADVAVTFGSSSGSTTASQKRGPDEPAPGQDARPYEPELVRPYEPELVRPDEPAPVRPYEPVRPDEPAPVRPDEPAQVAGQCTQAEQGQLSADPSDSSKFFRCVWGEFEHHTCADGLVFDQSVGQCNWAWALV